MEAPVNILIVDDEPKNLTVLETVLDDPGYRLVRAESADKALLALVVEEFALLILDIRMPGMTGFELAEMIKDRKKTARVPIIFLTAYYNEDQHVLAGYETGAVDYLHKPVNAAILRSKVAVFAELHRKSRECGMANRALLAEVTERRRAEEQLRELNETLEQRVTERTEALVLANADLIKSGERYRSLFDGSLDAIISMSADGHFEGANPAALELTGHTLEELTALPFLSLCAPDHREAAKIAFRDAYCRQCITIDTAIITATGERRELFFSGAPTIVDGVVVGVSCIARDVTERNRVEATLQVSEMRYRRLFEAAQDGVLILDFDSGKVVDVNPFMTNLLGYSRHDFIGLELWNLGLFSDQSANEAAVRELQEKGYLRYEHLPLKSKAGRRVEVEVVANAHQENHKNVIQCNIRDITDRSRLEKELQKQASELSDLHRRKDEFLAMLSHELRSPLAPISNAVQLLGMQQGSENPIQQQARTIIERQLGQLRHLVDDLLEVSRITTGRIQLHRERLVISDVVEGAVETVRPMIEELRHELTVSLPSEPIWLYVDAARLEQVLVNLLTNAAKYTNDGGHIWLTIELVSGTALAAGSSPGQSTLGHATTPAASAVPLTGSECIIRVRDNGVGIAPDLLTHVFDLFTQAERSLDRSQGGLGIGLALVLRLTELHGGKVEAFSELGQGSEFIVRLPMPPTDAPQSTLSVSETGQPTTRPLRVLVVDDNVDTVLSFTMLLQASGHDVQTAHDGPTAVQAALDYRPDVMLLDIGLPGLNGYEVAKRIRQQPDLKNVVLVALTGYGQEADRQTSLQAGFNQHMVKPIRFDQLQQILATVSEQVT